MCCRVIYPETNNHIRTPNMILSRPLMILGTLAALSACGTLNSPTFSDDAGAIRGYDPVAYHLENRPVKGKTDYTYVYNNATWLFSSQENLDLFRGNPARYAPEYGGYCAYGMSKGFVVSTDPDAWTIEDGKLYLNHSLGVRRTWLKDVPGNIDRADRHWRDKL